MKKLSRYLLLIGTVTFTIFTFRAYAQMTPAAKIAPLPVATPAPAPATAANGGSVGAVNKKLNLEDITVKGELLSDDRMNFVRRQREELKNRIKFRTNFRPEILEEYKK